MFLVSLSVFNSFKTSHPSFFGSIISNRIAKGFKLFAFSTASIPSYAWATEYPEFTKFIVKISEVGRSSSETSTKGLFLLALLFQKKVFASTVIKVFSVSSTLIAAAFSASRGFGRIKVKSVKPFSTDSKFICPPCSSIIFFVKASPRPVPSYCRE